MTSGASRSRAAIVIPSLNEPADLLIGLIRDIYASVPAAKVVIVDDSPAEHGESFAAEITAAHPLATVILRGGTPANGGGLGGAVVSGFRFAADLGCTYAIVMDADGQHPPTRLAELLLRLDEGPGHDLVIASRYRAGGSAGTGLGASRKAISRLSGTAAHLLFADALNSCSDPMSGFFGVRLSAVDLDFWADGFKVLLQLMAQHPQLRKAEIGYVFLERRGGTSKAGIAEGTRYLCCLFALRKRTRTARASATHPSAVGSGRALSPRSGPHPRS